MARLYASTTAPELRLRHLCPIFPSCTFADLCSVLTCIASTCEHCNVRYKMQQKYLNEAHELYDEFFHIVQLPLLTEEVRGPEKLKNFSEMLVKPYVPTV